MPSISSLFTHAHIEMLATISTTGSFAATGRKLYKQPNAIIQSISRLEQQIGQPLVNRDTKPMTLTEVGRIMASSKGIFDNLNYQINMASQVAMSEVSIATTAILAPLTYAQMMRTVTSNRDLHLRMAASPSSLCKQRWEEYDFDIWIDNKEMLPFSRQGCAIREFPHPEIAYWVHASHPLCKTHMGSDKVVRAKLAEIISYPLSSPTGIPQWWTEHFRGWVEDALGMCIPESFTSLASPFHHLTTGDNDLLHLASLNGAISGGIKMALATGQQYKKTGELDYRFLEVTDEPPYQTEPIFIAWNERNESVRPIVDGIIETIENPEALPYFA